MTVKITSTDRLRTEKNDDGFLTDVYMIKMDGPRGRAWCQVKVPRELDEDPDFPVEAFVESEAREIYEGLEDPTQDEDPPEAHGLGRAGGGSGSP